MVKVKPKPRRSTIRNTIYAPTNARKGNPIKKKRRVPFFNKIPNEKKYYSSLLDGPPKTPYIPAKERREKREKERREVLQKSYAKHDGRKKRKTRKDKGGKTRRRAAPGVLVAELRKSISM